jgi:hypothetical protein
LKRTFAAQNFHRIGPFYGRPLKVLLEKIYWNVVEMDFANYSAKLLINRIIFKSVFEVVNELEKSGFLGNSNCTTISNYIYAKFLGIVETLDSEPSPDSLL